MKFVNTKAQVKEVGTSAVEWGKATVNLTKAIIKVPVAVGKDVSVSAKEHSEMRKAWKEWKAQQERSDEA